MLAFIYSFIHESQNKWILNFHAYLKSQFMIPLQKSIMICLLYIFWILLLCMYWLLLVNVVMLWQIKGWNFGMHRNNNNWNWKLTRPMKKWITLWMKEVETCNLQLQLELACFKANSTNGNYEYFNGSSYQEG